MNRRYDHILAMVRDKPWAILPSVLVTIRDLVAYRVRGGSLSADEIQQRVAAVQTGERKGQQQAGGVAIIPLYGIITPKAGLMSEMSGATSLDTFARQFRAALADPDVASIILDVDSPGGLTDMVPEMAEEMRKARGQKPVTAVGNTLIASAAYWLATQADEIVASPSSLIGSIGVYAAHEDLSAAYEREGIKTTLISAGRFKAEGNEFEPLSDEARAHIQEIVDENYGQFTDDVAKGRGVTSKVVRAGYGEGRILTAKQAKAAGMVDRIGTLDETVSRLLKAPRRSTTQAWAAGLQQGLQQAMRVAWIMATAIPPHKSPAIASEDAEWDAGAEVAKAEGRQQLRRMHAWVDGDGDPDAKSSYKLPHHRADGTLVPRGLFASAQRFDQTDMPDSDRAGTRSHLDRHYVELDREPPWAKAEVPIPDPTPEPPPPIPEPDPVFAFEREKYERRRA